MEQHILIAESRDISRMGLKIMFAQDPNVASVNEVKTSEELQKELFFSSPDVIVIHQSLITDSLRLPRNHFVILATDPDEKMLFAAYTNGARGYLLESSTIELLRITLSLTENMFLLDPTLTPWLLKCINKDILPTNAEEVLTARENEVFHLLYSGLSNQAIGEKLCISQGTVKTHIAKIFHKLNIKRRSELISSAPIGMRLVLSS